MAPHVKAIYGASPLSNKGDEQYTEDIFKRLEEGGCKELDSTHDWPGAEEWLGKVKAGTRFIINGKTPGGIKAGTSTSKGIMEHAKELNDYVGKGNVDNYQLHAPDETLELEDMCKGMNDAHQAGYFRRFGLSNFTAKEVEEVFAICQKHGWVLPTVYEGNYNAVARRPEIDLLPTLRKLGISFYAYSPMCGGLLTKTPAQLKAGGAEAGRFTAGTGGIISGMYNTLYNRPSYHKALELWEAAAEKAGCTRAELAYRWVACDSVLSNDHGDAIVFGAAKPEQVSEILAWLKKGTVGEEAKSTIEEIWKVVESDAPLDNWNSYAKEAIAAAEKAKSKLGVY